MNIVHISESISSMAGGLQFTATGLSKTFKAKGHNVTFIAGKDNGFVNDFGVDTILLNKVGFSKFKLLKGLRKEIIKKSPDIIVQHGIWSLFNYQITKIASELGIPYFIVVHGMLDPYILKNNSFIKKLGLFLYQKNNLKNALFLRALNNNEKNHINAVVSNKVIVAPNAIDLNEANQLDVMKDRNQICFLGRIDNKKSVHELTKAWCELQNEKKLPSEASLKIAGWGSDKKYIQEFENIIKDIASISYVGPVFDEDKDLLLAKSGAFILPSKGEGLPTAVLEAWRAGAIVIMSPECNFPDDVFFDSAIKTSSDVNSIKQSLLDYYNMPETKYVNYHDKSKQRLQLYSWDIIADTLLAEMK